MLLMVNVLPVFRWPSFGPQWPPVMLSKLPNTGRWTASAAQEIASKASTPVVNQVRAQQGGSSAEGAEVQLRNSARRAVPSRSGRRRSALWPAYVVGPSVEELVL